MTRLTTGVSGVDSGPGQHNVRGIGGTFTLDADGSTSVSDADILSTSQIVCFPTNGPAGLILKSKSCFVNTIAAGSFVFNVSATGAGAPAGTETFAYLVT